jgi:hypothetical protein
VLFVGYVLKSWPRRISRQHIGLERKTRKALKLIVRKLIIHQMVRLPVEFSTGVTLVA